MRLAAKIAYNTIVQMASKIAATILGLVAIAYITRYLGQEGFGQYTTIITFLSFFGIVADLGLTLVTVQMISRPGIDEDRVLGNLLGLRLVSAVLFLGLAPMAVIFFPYGPVIRVGVAVTAFSFLFIALNQVLVGLFQKNLRMDKVSIAEVASRIILVAGTVAAIKLDRGLLGIMAAMVAASAASFLLHYAFARSFVRIRPCFDAALWREIISKSWPLAVTIFFNLIYLKADTLLLSLIERPTAVGIIAEVGIYGAAYKVIDVLVTFPFMFAGLVLPVMAARWAAGDRREFYRVLQKSFDVMVIIALPLIVGTQFVSRDIMVLIAGREFAASGPALELLIVAAGFIFLGNMFAHAIIAVDKQKKIIGAYIFTAITAVVGYLVLIPRFSYFGAAGVTIYSELSIAAASAFLVCKFTGFRPEWRVFFRSAAAAFFMGAVVYLFRHNVSANLAFVLPLGAFTYFLFLFLFGGVAKGDIHGLLNRQK